MSVRAVSWTLHIALPVLGLWLLLTQPHLDAMARHNVAHFWVVALAALVNVVLAARMSVAARGRGDARLFLVALMFLVSASFLGLHSLATPTVVVEGPNAGFALATPVGLAVASALAALSSAEWRAGGIVPRAQVPLLVGLIALIVGWGTVSLLSLPPLSEPVDLNVPHPPLVGLAAVAVALYLGAAARYYALYRRRPAVVLLSVITAFVLLAEAMVAIALAPTWQLSWWEWHVLMLLAFGFVAYSARVQYVREGSAAGLFDGIALDETLNRIRREHRSALEALVDAVRRQAETGIAEPVDVLAMRVGERFELTERQTEVLARSAEALASERDQIARLGALVAIGREARVIQAETALLEHALALARPVFPRDRLAVGLVRDGALRYLDGAPAAPATLVDAVCQALEPAQLPHGDGTALVLPLQVKGNPAGVLEVCRARGGFAERERAVLSSLASQLSIAVENARLYRQLDGLFHSYMSPAVATAMIADPDQAKLGGATAEVTVLFADLEGFTPFAERTPPDQVVALLNRYYRVAVPLLLAEGGTIVQFVGDEVMALFNAPVRQRDHALRAARAGLAVQQAIGALVADHPGWPRFRVGVNTGLALVGNIGSDEMRNYTAIGDTTNLAARLQAAATAGMVLLGPATYAQIRDVAEVDEIGPLQVKGKAAPVPAYALRALRLLRAAPATRGPGDAGP
jgi:class 3 adenylate cyclase